jgi:hypothetical protein
MNEVKAHNLRDYQSISFALPASSESHSTQPYLYPSASPALAQHRHHDTPWSDLHLAPSLNSNDHLRIVAYINLKNEHLHLKSELVRAQKAVEREVQRREDFGEFLKKKRQDLIDMNKKSRDERLTEKHIGPNLFL